MTMVLLLPSLIVRADDAQPEDMTSVFLAAPLVGAVRNEVDVQGPPGAPAQTLADTAAEYGLFAMYANPRLVINDTLFNTDVNDAKVWGNISTLNVYGGQVHTESVSRFFEQ